MQKLDCRMQNGERVVAVRAPFSPFNLQSAIPNLQFVVLLTVAFLAAPSRAEEKPSPPKFTKETLRGRVVFLAEALEKKYGVKSVTEARQAALALQDDAGKLHPLVEDIRGRAFRVDKRLRDIQVELLVRRYVDSPAVQIIGVYELAKEGRFEIDYWCSVCAIAMYELKECECCQGEIELRKRKTDGK